jgi:hypothetical protein
MFNLCAPAWALPITANWLGVRDMKMPTQNSLDSDDDVMDDEDLLLLLGRVTTLTDLNIETVAVRCKLLENMLTEIYQYRKHFLYIENEKRSKQKLN